jgi:hypothetical protein
MYTCPVCEFEYETRGGLAMHWTAKHAPISADAVPSTLRAQLAAAQARAERAERELKGAQLVVCSIIEDLGGEVHIPAVRMRAVDYQMQATEDDAGITLTVSRAALTVPQERTGSQERDDSAAGGVE